MAVACRVCDSQGRLLDEVCPLCEGDPSFFDDIERSDHQGFALPIFILAGQSNCVGRGAPTDVAPALAERVAGQVRISFDLERHRPEESHASDWTPLTPTCQVNPLYGSHFGPEISFADDLCTALSSSEILVVKFAMGSSSLVMSNRDGGDPEWDPEGEHVREMLQLLRKRCASIGRPAYFAGMLWNQGNSDLKVKEADGSSERYTETLVQLVARVREDLRQFHRGLPFVACHVRKGSKAKTTQQVNTAISRACERISNAACVPIPDGATLLSGDDFHFDGPSLLSQGHGLAKAMCKLLDVPRQNP